MNLWRGYCAAISTKAARHIRNQIMKYKIHRATGADLEQIAQSLAPKLRGWIRYFSPFYPSALREVFSALNARLVRWITNKYKSFRRRKYQAWQKLKEIASDFPNLFEHWKYGYTP
ncbi:group II intron maturase-specific domain-containing protein [Phaeodactylibacter luteus]|nr:group II intron maturase-specific domain-containing protein [Phaeodactylibacter luteus]